MYWTLVWGFVFTFVFIALNILYWIMCNIIGTTDGNSVVHLWSIRIWFYMTFIVLIKSDWSDWLNLCHTSQDNGRAHSLPNLFPLEIKLWNNGTIGTTQWEKAQTHSCIPHIDKCIETYIPIDKLRDTERERQNSQIHCSKTRGEMKLCLRKRGVNTVSDAILSKSSWTQVKRTIIIRIAVKK